MKVFYAITLTPKCKSKLAIYRDLLSSHALKGRFTSTENIHLTLEFIGEIKNSNLHFYEDIIDLLTNDPFDLKVTHVGQFPKKNRAVLWLGLDQSDPLLRLQHNLNLLLEAMELVTETRKYHPHITLGRQIILDIQTDDITIPPLDLELDSIALMTSHRVKDVLKYEPIYEKKFNNNPY